MTSEREDWFTGVPEVFPQHCALPLASAQAELVPAATYEKLPDGALHTLDILLPEVNNAPVLTRAMRNPPPRVIAFMDPLPAVPGTATPPIPNPTQTSSARFAAKDPLAALTDPASATYGEDV